MLNNDVLRSIRYILNVSEFTLADIVKYGGGDVTQAEINTYIKKEDEPGFVKCPQNILAHFLNGLIYQRRGKDPSRPALTTDLPTNNNVMKKLRVAFELKDTDFIEMLKEGGFEVSKSELSALFRKEGHQHYKVCGDQYLRQVLKALATRERTKNPAAPGT
jgi:uncharacterized protein YehS (DUF1456 family)